jgi:hypothetical protein
VPRRGAAAPRREAPLTLRRLLPALAALLLLGGVPAPALADRATADFYAQRGEKALLAQDWAGAQEQFRKAIAEDGDHLPGHLGLAEAFLGAGSTADGLAALRRAVEVAESLKPLPAAWTSAASRARRRLAEVDVSGAQLERTIDRYVADLLSFADRWTAKDLDAAALALAEAQRLRPDHSRAKAVAAKIAKADEASWVSLWDGVDKAGWDGLDREEWKVIGGEMRGEVGETPLLLKAKTLSGDHDVRVVARILDGAMEGPARMMLLFPWTSDAPYAAFGVEDGHLVWREEQGKVQREPRLRMPLAEVPSPFDPAGLNVYEMRFRGDEVVALVNKKVVGTFPRSKDRGTGQLALRVQDVRASFLRVEVRSR